MVKKASAKKSAKSNSKKPPHAGLDLFGRPPLVGAEDRAAFETMLARVMEDVKPNGIVEEILVHDFVHHTWDILRLRRAKVALIQQRSQDHLQQMFIENREILTAKEISARWANGDSDAINYVNAKLAEWNTSADKVVGQSLASIIDKIDQFDCLIMNKEVRRNAGLRELHVQRAALAHALRNSREIQDAEFTVKKDAQLISKGNEAPLNEDMETQAAESETESLHQAAEAPPGGGDETTDGEPGEDEVSNYREAAE